MLHGFWIGWASARILGDVESASVDGGTFLNLAALAAWLILARLDGPWSRP